MYNSYMNEVLGSEEVSLKDMLDAREERVAKQQNILSRYKITLISFTLNIPGSYKAFHIVYKSFLEGKKLIKEHLKRYSLNIAYEEDSLSKTGYENFIAVDGNPQYIKKLMVEIENSCLLGRIFDIDVLDIDGKKISRKDIGEEGRRCLLCSEFAHVCSRSRNHPLEELINKTIEIMIDYFSEKFANMCSACASKALIYEVMTTPKPGLVDRVNNGSHKDMDIYTFIDSSEVLVYHFKDFVLAGIKYHSEHPQKLFERLRYMGMKAEDDMFKATKNVNTHKGLIFSMGIICAALGFLFGNKMIIDVESILSISKNMTESVLDDFKGITIENAKTYGERLYALHGIDGIRGEASRGFISVKEYGLPVLKDLINKGFSINDAGSLTLLNLIANVKDTNIITRTDIETQRNVQSKIRNLIKENHENISLQRISSLDKEFIDMNISPGGCADLLAITYMLYFIQEIYKDEY